MLFMAALLMSAGSGRRPDMNLAFGPAATGAGCEASRRVDRVFQAGVSCHASASFWTAFASLKSEFVICFNGVG